MKRKDFTNILNQISIDETCKLSILKTGSYKIIRFATADSITDLNILDDNAVLKLAFTLYSTVYKDSTPEEMQHAMFNLINIQDTIH